MPEMIVAHDSIQQRLGIWNHLSISSKKRDRNNFKEADLHRAPQLLPECFQILCKRCLNIALKKYRSAKMMFGGSESVVYIQSSFEIM